MLLSCGHGPETAEATTPIAPVETNSAQSAPDKVQATQDQEAVSSYQHELNKALNDSTIELYYNNVYSQGKLIPASDDVMLSITDSLLTHDPDRKLFYFIVFTKSMNGADGFYAEAVGLSAFNFVTTRPEWFADYFNISPRLTDKDMDNWAKCIYGEIQISEEGHEQEAVKDLENVLLHDTRELRGEYKSVIEKLIEKIKSTAHNKAYKQ